MFKRTTRGVTHPRAPYRSPSVHAELSKPRLAESKHLIIRDRENTGDGEQTVDACY